MILDHLENWPRYTTQDSLIAKAFRFLEKLDPELEDGRYDIDGENCFALVQSYNTRAPEECRFEAHRRYLDIQYVFAGAEGMGWAPAGGLNETIPYDEGKEAGFFADPEMPTLLIVQAGQFALFYPEDAHAPGIALPGFSSVRKVVVKVAVGLEAQ